MKKNFWKYTVLVCGLLAFAACGKKDEKKEQAKAQAKPTPQASGNTVTPANATTVKLQKLERTVTLLDQKLSTLQSSELLKKSEIDSALSTAEVIEKLQRDLSRLKSTAADRGAVERMNADLNENIATLQENLKALKAKVDAMSSEAPDIQADRESVEGPTENQASLNKDVEELKAAVADIYLKLKTIAKEEEVQEESQTESTYDSEMLRFAQAVAQKDETAAQKAAHALRKLRIPRAEMLLAKLDDKGNLTPINKETLVKALTEAKAKIEELMKSDEFKNSNDETQKAEATLELELLNERLAKFAGAAEEEGESPSQK